ncbi:MAG: FAD-dependent monooxygenase [Pseudomonadota bacterium]
MKRGEGIERDVLMLGGGPAGLAAALFLAKQGLTVALVDRDSALAADGAESRPRKDLRTAALLQPAIEALRRAGVWERIAPTATPLNTMRLVDAGGAANRARTRTDFAAREVEKSAFGANVANAELKAALLSAVGEEPAVTLFAPSQARQLTLREDAVLAELSTGERIRAAVAVGADGRESQVRAAAGLQAPRFDYGQDAMVFTVSHDQPHQNISTEILREGGPFTLVPFLDAADGTSRSSVVWMEGRKAATRLMALDDAAFEEAVNDRSLGVLGRLTVCSRRMAWPVITQLATRFHGRRAALIAEAAHVTPPIGAQGLNMSLADGETLASLLGEAKRATRDLGSEAVLAQLTRRRYGDVARRLAATAALNGAAIGALRPVRDLRQAGLEILRRSPPLRQAAMRFGLG